MLYYHNRAQVSSPPAVHLDPPTSGQHCLQGRVAPNLPLSIGHVRPRRRLYRDRAERPHPEYIDASKEVLPDLCERVPALDDLGVIAPGAQLRESSLGR